MSQTAPKQAKELRPRSLSQSVLCQRSPESLEEQCDSHGQTEPNVQHVLESPEKQSDSHGQQQTEPHVQQVLESQEQQCDPQGQQQTESQEQQNEVEQELTQIPSSQSILTQKEPPTPPPSNIISSDFVTPPPNPNDAVFKRPLPQRWKKRINCSAKPTVGKGVGKKDKQRLSLDDPISTTEGLIKNTELQIKSIQQQLDEDSVGFFIFVIN